MRPCPVLPDTSVRMYDKRNICSVLLIGTLFVGCLFCAVYSLIFVAVVFPAGAIFVLYSLRSFGGYTQMIN